MLYIFKAISKIHIKIILLSAVFLFLQFSSAYSYTAVVESARLNMRSSPLLGAPVTAVLSKGDSADIKGPVKGPWVKVLYNGKIGYLRNRPIYIQIISDSGNIVIKEKEAGKQKEIIQRKIKRERKILKRYRKKSETILSGLDEIDKSVNKARKQLITVKKNYLDVGNRIRHESKKLSYLEKEIVKIKPYVSKRIVSLYKFLRVGKMNLLFSVDSVVDFVKRQKALKDIVSSDLEIIERYSSLKNEYSQSLKKLDEEKVKLDSLKAEISKYLRIQEAEKDKKRVLLKEIRQKQSIKLSVINSLEKASKNLDEKMKLLKEKEKARVSLKSFHSYKGLLNLPVKGKIISGFGKRSKNSKSFYSYKNGIGIKADLGEPVHSVFYGEVVFSDWFKGYGNMLIINHGKSYYSIYAHVQEFFKQKGDKVQKDEVIATLGETGSLDGPVLHFEVRHHGKPLNPLEWIKK